MIRTAIACLAVIGAVTAAATPASPLGMTHGNTTKHNLRDDPADSWLAYAVAKGGGKLVTYVYASWVVPSAPAAGMSSSAPGWWFGIEPEPAADLIQPILAYGYTDNGYQIFNGYFQWDNGEWWTSDVSDVSPGNTINAWVQLNPDGQSYHMNISCVETGWSTGNDISIESGATYTDVYFVVEHQPPSCDQYPASGSITFQDIEVRWEHEPSTPTWKGFTYQDACNCQPHILSDSAIKFTWDTS